MQVAGRHRDADTAQAVADAPAGILVACATTRQETAAGQRGPLIQPARENLGPAAHDTTTVADGGSGAGAALQAPPKKR